MHELVRHAAEARRQAYAPYSGYKVGACVMGSNGRLYMGCNVENISYGLTICAERSAITAMVLAGCVEILEVAVVTRDGGTPCGACLQVIAEFAFKIEHVKVHCATEDGEMQTYDLKELLPHGFTSTEVRQNGTDARQSE